MVNVYGEMTDSLGTRWRKLTDVEIHTTTCQRYVKFEDYDETRMEAAAAEVQASEQQDEIDMLKETRQKISLALHDLATREYKLYNFIKDIADGDIVFYDHAQAFLNELNGE